MKENEIKIRLIDHLLAGSFSGTEIIGNEVNFFYGSRRADIICLTDKIATSYEIKSESDSTERLAYQIDSYKKYFDFCYVVCEQSNLKSIRSVSPKGVGILVVRENDIVQIRKAQRYQKHDKKVLLDTVSANVLRTLSKSLTNISKKDMCDALSKKMTLEEARSLSRKSLYKKLRRNFDAFYRDKGQATNTDDLLTLSRSPSSLLSM